MNQRFKRYSGKQTKTSVRIERNQEIRSKIRWKSTHNHTPSNPLAPVPDPDPDPEPSRGLVRLGAANVSLGSHPSPVGEIIPEALVGDRILGGGEVILGGEATCGLEKLTGGLLMYSLSDSQS